MGDFYSSTANKLMPASTTSPDPTAVKNEVSYFIKNYPVFYAPDQDWISAVSKRVGWPRATRS